MSEDTDFVLEIFNDFKYLGVENGKLQALRDIKFWLREGRISDDEAKILYSVFTLIRVVFLLRV